MGLFLCLPRAELRCNLPPFLQHQLHLQGEGLLSKLYTQDHSGISQCFYPKGWGSRSYGLEETQEFIS